jgi:hypothetical protein
MSQSALLTDTPVAAPHAVTASSVSRVMLTVVPR